MVSKPRVIWSAYWQAWTWPWAIRRPSKELIAFVAELNWSNRNG
ncbi:hypothetical protein CPT_Ptah_008 [Stenotrophomonas phage Ptah]|uniref:Uncharacterized protein n=1 Tax=Stenotrophomonas phage Ptah TaxID=2859657 RepID=A0AAE8BLA6_9CAUD|nr:hypothetical protein CPT_Ptah_008 [Stenotrophomonas phage Ptah]